MVLLRGTISVNNRFSFLKNPTWSVGFFIYGESSLSHLCPSHTVNNVEVLPRHYILWSGSSCGPARGRGPDLPFNCCGTFFSFA